MVHSYLFWAMLVYWQWHWLWDRAAAALIINQSLANVGS
jgi:hypothetical protein